LENYVELSKKIEDVMKTKSNLSKVDNSQENPLDEMTIISAKGKKKRRRRKIVRESVKSKVVLK
jgi:hypothetical protein